MSDRTERSFQTELAIAAPPEAVWSALTEAREIERWFAPDATVEARPGGRLVWAWDDQCRWEQTIEAIEPGQHLRTRYDSAVPDPAGGRRPLFVDFHLEGDRGVTRLRVVHSGFGPEASFDAEFDGISQGWPVELRSLRLYLERHRGADRHVAWERRSTDAAPTDVWRRLVGPDGLQAPDLASRREGEPFAVRLGDLGPIDGTTLFVPGPREFSGVVGSLGDAWLRVHCEHWNGATQVWLWLALYSRHGRRTDAIRTAFAGLLDRCVPAAATPESRA